MRRAQRGGVVAAQSAARGGTANRDRDGSKPGFDVTPWCGLQARPGRPVFRAGTLAKMATKFLSSMALNAMMPARSNSLFFTLRCKLLARCFRPSMAWYSSLGMVKLSRTNLGFLGALVLGAATVLAAGADARATALVAMGFGVGATLRAGDLTARLAATGRALAVADLTVALAAVEVAMESPC